MLNNFPEPKVKSSHCFFCLSNSPKPKDSAITIGTEIMNCNNFGDFTLVPFNNFRNFTKCLQKQSHRVQLNCSLVTS